MLCEDGSGPSASMKGTIMDMLEKVELVREKTGVSYDDAKVALEACAGDVLDAIIWLERLGKASVKTASYSTYAGARGPVSPEMAQAQASYEESSRKTKASEGFSNLASALKRLCKKGLDCSFVVEREGKRICSVPVLVLVILTLMWGASIPLLIVGLFLGCHYSFEGAGDLGRGVNRVMDAAADSADGIKRTVLGDDD